MSLKKFKHVILTRFNLGLYDTENADEWMKHRWPLFEKTRESVLSQDGDFEWWLCVDARTPDRWLNKMADECVHFTSEHPKEYEPDGWTITTRLDNDDLYLPGVVKAIQDCFIEEEIVVDLKYQQLCKGVLYSSGIERDGWERPRPNGPFLSLISKEKNCYARPHSKMGQFNSIFASDEVLAYMVIHDNNIGNQIVGRKV